MDESSYIDNPRNAAKLPDVVTNWGDPASVAAFMAQRSRKPVRCQPTDPGAYCVIEIGEQHWYTAATK